MLTTIIALATGKLTHAVGFILYRLASWSGSIALYRHGKQTGRKSYYVAAAAVYVASWLLVLFIARGALGWLRASIG